MAQTFHYRTITGYRELPPRIRVIYPEGSDMPPARRYLREHDQAMEQFEQHYLPASGTGDDLAAHVFGTQLARQATQAYHLAQLLTERQQLADRHLQDIQQRIEQLKQRTPLRVRGPGIVDDGKFTDVEKQTFDLERQQRNLQVELWRDVLEIRKAVAESRAEHRATRSRIDYLTGGDVGAA